jgi:hypothetical protein
MALPQTVDHRSGIPTDPKEEDRTILGRGIRTIGYKRDYLEGEWFAWHAIRELIQNKLVPPSFTSRHHINGNFHLVRMAFSCLIP